MIRPFAVIGFSYLIILMMLSFIGVCIPLIMIVILCLIFLATLLSKNLRRTKVVPCVMFVAIIAVNVFNLKLSRFLSVAKEFDDVDINITGSLCDVPYKMNGKFYYVIDANILTSSDEPERVRIKISSSETFDADVFDEVSCSVHTFLPENVGIMSYRNYAFSRGINLTGYVNQDSVSSVSVKKNANKTSYSFLLKMRMAISNSIKILLPNELSSIATGMLLGDKYMMDASVKENFRDLGVSHLLAVSGLHTAVIAKLLQIIFSLFGFGKKSTSIFSCVGIFLFMAVTGFSPSVMRAGIMAILFFIGNVINRKPDSLNSLGLAVLIILLINPFASGDVGMILSFLATLGIILFESPIRKSLRLPKFIASTISVTVSATILTLPIIMIGFGKISLLSVIANILLVVPSMIMVPCILLAALFSFCGVLRFLCYPLAFFAGIIIKYIISCSEFLIKIPFASINISQPHLTLWLILSLILFAFTLIIFEVNRKMLKTLSLLSVIMFLVSIFSNQFSSRNLTSLAVIDVGVGCSTILIKNGHAAVLTCGGNKYKSKNVIEYLEKQNIRSIDFMCVPSYYDVSCLYADEILSKYKVSTLLVYQHEKLEEKITESLFPEKCTYYFDDNVTANLWENVKIEITSHMNKSFIKLTVNNVTTLICPAGGDVAELDENFCKCDFFVTGNLPKNISNIYRTYSVLSTDEKSIERLVNPFNRYDDKSYITAKSGNVIIDFIRDNKISVRRFL